MKRFVISGSSGAGKSAVIQRLCQLKPVLHVAVSHTSRPPRVEEIPGIHYHFVDEAAFLRMIRENAFLEYTLQKGTYYGTAWAETLGPPGGGISCLLFDLDLSGALAMKQVFPDTALIFLQVPAEEIEKRLRSRERGRMSEDEIQFRLQKGQRELTAAKGSYDYIVENSALDTCVREILEILDSQADPDTPEGG